MTAARAVVGLFLCCALTACRSNSTREFDRANLPPPPAKVDATQLSKSSPLTSTEAPRSLPSGPVAKVDPYPVGSTDNVLRGQDAIGEIQKRATSGGKVNSLVWKDGKMTVTTDYPDGSSMSIVSGSNGNELEFRPAK